ncbi:hypothetical protein LC087_03875 [Bacillus carboniphilus]|uniref:Uncharacterized protein n=1 Tax=Bacillus carboniphilus TaxID=86663 RepID=A0ABY9JX17_9BACI|nr:hypothetical protein [Bacillus carboniphilus]WLR43334.1 hypothetical protein LC087_03875 [Bacillus carboniphilus]
MSGYYDLCCQYRGKQVRIRDRQGNIHTGRINRVTRDQVFLQPSGPPPRGFGFGYYRRPYPPYGPRPYPFFPAYGIALGFILGVALVGAFFW